MKLLNVVFIGAHTFPKGQATTKRRRFLVDYMNSVGISSHVLVTCLKTDTRVKNNTSGIYGLADYYDLTKYVEKLRLLTFYREGFKHLRKWCFDNCQNVLVFPTCLAFVEWPFYYYAKRIGYKIVFDQVETSYLLNGRCSFLHKINIWLSEKISYHAYKNSAAFVISSALYDDNRQKFPNRKICLLPNSTPIYSDLPKKELHNPLVLLYSGTYSPKDGVNYLIDGVIEAVDRGCNCKLILLGKGTDNDMKVLKKIEGRNYIDYQGFVSDDELINIMKTSDVLCMTRTNSIFANYGFPFKLSEYLATGNVVIATNVGDVTMYLTNKENAIIIPAEDSHEIAQSLLYIQDNPSEAIKIANNSIAVVEKYFSVESVGEKFVDFLLKI